jgi:hypothetical protein
MSCAHGPRLGVTPAVVGISRKGLPGETRVFGGENMKSPRMAARGTGVRTIPLGGRRRKPRPARGMVRSGTGVSRKTKQRIWDNWLMEENYL